MSDNIINLLANTRLGRLIAGVMYVMYYILGYVVVTKLNHWLGIGSY